MFIKTSLLACGLFAAVGCRTDRTERDEMFQRPVESSDRIDPERPVSPSDTDTDHPTLRTNAAGHTVHETGARRQGGESGQIGDEATGTVMSEPAPSATTQTPSDAAPPATGTSETAAGTGTTTNTGINTENAGTGGDDDPHR